MDEAQVVSALAEIKAEIVAIGNDTQQISAHLARLNGTVAEHSAELATQHDRNVAADAVAGERQRIRGSFLTAPGAIWSLFGIITGGFVIWDRLT